MPLLSAAISDSPTACHVIDWLARKNPSSVRWRRENQTPTKASAARYAITISASSGRMASVMAITMGRDDQSRKDRPGVLHRGRNPVAAQRALRTEGVLSAAGSRRRLADGPRG